MKIPSQSIQHTLRLRGINVREVNHRPLLCHPVDPVFDSQCGLQKLNVFGENQVPGFANQASENGLHAVLLGQGRGPSDQGAQFAGIVVGCLSRHGFIEHITGSIDAYR